MKITMTEADFEVCDSRYPALQPGAKPVDVRDIFRTVRDLRRQEAQRPFQ